MKTEYFASPEIKALTEHSRELGWYSEADWECFVRTGVVYGHRLQSNEIVSSAYFSNFENRIGYMGAVIVNPRFQGKKLGRDLIQKALSMVPDDDFVLALIATERGKRMYEQAGFVEVGNTHKFVGELSATEVIEKQVRAFHESDFESIVALDTVATGCRRIKLLRERLKTAEVKFVFEKQPGAISGYLFANKEPTGRISLGPIVANSPADALSLLRSATASGGNFRIDVPHWQSDFLKVVSEVPLQLERICPLLTYRGRPLPIASDHYFALVSQALG